MKIWKLLKSEFAHSTFSTFSIWGKAYADPLDASKEMYAQYTARFNLHSDDAIIAEYHPGTCANLVLKDGRRWTWTIDGLEVA